MTQEQWNTGWMRSLAVMFNGETLNDADEMGEPVIDDTFLILLNSSGDNVTYTLPLSPQNRGWKLVMNTHDLEQPFDSSDGGALDVAGRSVVLLRELAPEEAEPAGVQELEESGEMVEAVAPAESSEPAAGSRSRSWQTAFGGYCISPTFSIGVVAAGFSAIVGPRCR